MRILLFGKEGQVGWELHRALAPLGEVVAVGRVGPRGGPVDFGKADELAATVRELRPDIIVNAAAYTAVDKAESEPDLARTVNALAPEALAREARALSAYFVHFSTDYVFDGSGSTPRDESAVTGPLNVYGRTKLEGEERIRASGCRHLILRTSWVYSARGTNFLRTMLRLAAERDRLPVVDDQIGAPTGAELIADVTAHALRTARDSAALDGTYHVVAAGETTWYRYARFGIEQARALRHPVRVAPDDIVPIRSDAFPSAAKRPLNSRLGTRKLSAAFGLTLPPWQSGVERALHELLGK
jgi:dTDP-4-dehydrorhamnose reductase